MAANCHSAIGLALLCLRPGIGYEHISCAAREMQAFITFSAQVFDLECPTMMMTRIHLGSVPFGGIGYFVVIQVTR